MIRKYSKKKCAWKRKEVGKAGFAIEVVDVSYNIKLKKGRAWEKKTEKRLEVWTERHNIARRM